MTALGSDPHPKKVDLQVYLELVRLAALLRVRSRLPEQDQLEALHIVDSWLREPLPKELVEAAFVKGRRFEPWYRDWDPEPAYGQVTGQ